MKIKITDIIITGWNPRTYVDTTDLQDSMAAVGQKTPIQITANRELIGGHRRITAAKALGWSELDAEIIEVVDKRHQLSLMMADNVTQTFRPTEWGRGLHMLIANEGCTLLEAARICGKDPADAQLLLDLTNAPERIQRLVDSGQMSLTAWKTLRNQSESVKVAVAETIEPTSKRGKVTTEAVRRAVHQAIDPSNHHQNLLTAMEQTALVQDMRKIVREIQQTWGTGAISESDSLTIQYFVHQLSEIVGGNHDNSNDC